MPTSQYNYRPLEPHYTCIHGGSIAETKSICVRKIIRSQNRKPRVKMLNNNPTGNPYRSTHTLTWAKMRSKIEKNNNVDMSRLPHDRTPLKTWHVSLKRQRCTNNIIITYYIILWDTDLIRAFSITTCAIVANVPLRFNNNAEPRSMSEIRLWNKNMNCFCFQRVCITGLFAVYYIYLFFSALFSFLG